MKKLLVICGATATGKTALAVECAKRINGEVVSCDALLIYRGLDIGTAKPTEEERGGIAHHLIDVADANDAFSVGDFEEKALPVVEDILSRGKVPVLCGGTGFYMNAVLYRRGYGHAAADEEIRLKYEKFARERGNAALHARLQEVDPESAAVLHENDVKRVIRALEIYEVTGKKKSEQCDGATPRYAFEAFAFDYPREELYRRIDARVENMLERGLVEEVRSLLQSGVSEKAQCMQGIGYKEVVQFLKGECSHSTMCDIIKQNTRRYAKRQITFFKKTERLHWLAPMNLQDAAREVLQIYDGN